MKRTPQHRAEMAKRKNLRRNPTPYIPLFDYFTGEPDPKLIGYYNFATGVILTENFTPSLGGSKTRPNLAHDRRVRALDDRVKVAQKEVAARESAEAPAES